MCINETDSSGTLQIYRASFGLEYQEFVLLSGMGDTLESIVQVWAGSVQRLGRILNCRPVTYVCSSLCMVFVSCLTKTKASNCSLQYSAL